jgi:hypothetical protein
MCRLSKNLGASTSWNPKGLSRPVMGLIYLYLCTEYPIIRFELAVKLEEGTDKIKIKYGYK